MTKTMHCTKHDCEHLTMCPAPAHTPGPWSVYAGKGKHDERFIINEKSDFIASAQDLGAEADANARLIAAAPDLLEAVKIALSAIGPQADMPGGAADRVIADRLRVAIAKAEGN